MVTNKLIELSNQSQIVKERLHYHFGKIGGGWNIEGMNAPFMNEFLNEVAKLVSLSLEVVDDAADNNIKRNVELLNELGYEYIEAKDRFYSPENDSYLPISLECCKDIFQVVAGIVRYEREIGYYNGEKYAQRVMRSALGIK